MLALLLLLCQPDAKAEGFGASARGGDGGRVIEVTTLDDDGAGSLRAALAATGARVIRFKVEGTIELKSRLRVANGRVTVDGDGRVTLLNHGIGFVGDCDDIIVRHLRIRVTQGGDQGDCLLLWGRDGGTVERVLVDHCSLIGATDEGVNTWGDVRDVTVQWTIIAEGRNAADHPKGFHNYGWLSGRGSDRITIHHCLFASNADRSPKLQGGLYDVVNNVVFNWTGNNATKINEGARANVVGNSYVAGPRSNPARGCVFVDHDATQVFAAGNASSLTPKGGGDASLNVTWYEGSKEHRPAPARFLAKKRFESPVVATQTADEAHALVLKHAGARMRDDEDKRVLREVEGKK